MSRKLRYGRDVVPQESAWELINQLEFASKYLRGMRIQNYSNSWSSLPPKDY